MLRTVAAVLALIVAAGLAVATVSVQRAAPRPDAFYDPPASVPSRPGALLRSEPFTRGVPEDSVAWRILYTTTRDGGVPAIASGIVVAPSAPTDRARPVIAWAHGTTGIVPGCAPSVLDEPFESGALFVLPQVIERDWVLVATDYVGLGTAGPHPYLIGQGEARSVLDAVRAARQLPAVRVSEQTVVWGHSQGGNAGLWTGIVAPAYAADVPLAGVAALAPASNLPALVDHLPSVTGGSLFGSYVIDAYSEIFPDVDVGDVVRPAGRIIMRESATHCLSSDPGVLVAVGVALVTGDQLLAGDPTSGPFARRLADNIPSGPVDAPTLIGQGEDDSLVTPAAQQAYVRQRCAAGHQVEYSTYPGRDHVSLVQPDSPAVSDLLAWTEDRLAGKPPSTTC